ncbi:MAG: hypothetical protein PHQ46_07900 [Negativicutes bacterium]|nr:hypothetical protein [Negativicutes bacterium]
MTCNSSEAVQAEPYLSVIIQDSFSSNAAREEFIQSITCYGMALLRCSKTPREKLSRALSKFWALRRSREGKQ